MFHSAVPSASHGSSPFGSSTVVFKGVTMTEVEQLAGPLGNDRLRGSVGGLAHRVATGSAGQVAGTGDRDGHRAPAG